MTDSRELIENALSALINTAPPGLYRSAVDLVLSAVSAAGYAIVPVEATEKMRMAGAAENQQLDHHPSMASIWCAMIEAGRVR